MSYILDALKKTEQERQRGTTPSLNTEHRQGPRRPKRPPWQYLLVVVLLLNAGILIWWLKPWLHGQKEEGQLAVMAKTAKSVPPVIPSAAVRSPRKVVKSSATSTPPSFPAASEPGVSARGQLGRGQAGPGEPGQRSGIAAEGIVTAPGTEKGAGPQKRTPESLTSASKQKERPEADQQRHLVLSAETAGGSIVSVNGDVNGIPVSMPPTRKAGQSVQGIPQGLRQPATIAGAPELAGKRAVADNLQNGRKSGRPSSDGSGVNDGVAVVGKVLLDYNQLPSSVRQQLPPLTISLHLYADKPERRMANIDGRMCHEKEQIDKDLLVEEITSDGVIFNYAGRRFLKKVF